MGQEYLKEKKTDNKEYDIQGTRMKESTGDI